MDIATICLRLYDTAVLVQVRQLTLVPVNVLPVRPVFVNYSCYLPNHYVEVFKSFKFDAWSFPVMF